jgi:ADP-ribose pyrophosphatase
MEGAIRELEEEIGVRAAKIEKLSEFYVSPGFLTEKMHVYLATELTETEQKLEEDEILTVERHGFADLFEMIRAGEIEDAKTIAGVILAGSRRGFSF